MKFLSKKMLCAFSASALLVIGAQSQAFKQPHHAQPSVDLNKATQIDVNKMVDFYIQPFKNGQQVLATVAAVDKDGVAQLAQVNVFEQAGKIGLYLNNDTTLGQKLLHGIVTVFITSKDNKYAVEVQGGAQVNMSRRIKGHELYSVDPSKIIFFAHTASDGKQERIKITRTQWHNGHWVLVSETINDCLNAGCFVF